MTPEEIFILGHRMGMAMMAARYSMSLQATFNPNFFSGWAPPATSFSPSTQLPPLTVLPALSTSNINNDDDDNNEGRRNETAKKKLTKTNYKQSAENADSTNLPTSVTSEIGKKSKEGKRGQDKTFTCGVCSRSFDYKHVLQNHERTHTGERPFQCPECNKKFTRDHHLKTHMRLHTGEKPYHCRFCSRNFVQAVNLRRHLRVHTGEHPYTCNVYNAKFSDSNQLKAHAMIHKSLFKCTKCQALFRREDHLEQHKCSNSNVATVSSQQMKRGHMDLPNASSVETENAPPTERILTPMRKRNRGELFSPVVAASPVPNAPPNPTLPETEALDFSITGRFNNTNSLMYVSQIDINKENLKTFRRKSSRSQKGPTSDNDQSD